jgi:hypothetical protein
VIEGRSASITDMIRHYVGRQARPQVTEGHPRNADDRICLGQPIVPMIACLFVGLCSGVEPGRYADWRMFVVSRRLLVAGNLSQSFG